MHQYKEKLAMRPHEEGGYFAENYKASAAVAVDAAQYGGDSERAAGTSIYYLLEKKDYSAWHRLKSDEIWHYYDGESAVNILTISPEGAWRAYKLGNPTYDEDAAFQVVLPAGTWFAAALEDEVSFALMGCTVCPGFDYNDFELAEKAKLIAEYPQYEHYIAKYCRG